MKRNEMMKKVLVKYGAKDKATTNFFRLCYCTSNNEIANRVIKKCYNRLMNESVVKVSVKTYEELVEII